MFNTLGWRALKTPTSETPVSEVTWPRSRFNTSGPDPLGFDWEGLAASRGTAGGHSDCPPIKILGIDSRNDRSLTWNAIKGQRWGSKLYISPHFHKNRGRNTAFLHFFFKYKSRNYTNFPETWKKGDRNDGAYVRHEMFSFFTDFHRNLILLWIKTSRPEQNCHCFADDIFQ